MITTLHNLITALDTMVIAVHGSDEASDVEISSVAVVDGVDLGPRADLPPARDLWIMVGLSDQQISVWLETLASFNDSRRPRSVMVKTDVQPEKLSRVASTGQLAVVTVHPKARWEQVFSLVQRLIQRPARDRSADPDLVAPDTDLFGLAQAIASNTGGMVSIEDAQSRVLAYSSSDGAADELRTLSILGREGPRDYLKALRQSGVFDRLRSSGDVIEVPAHPELRTRRRLVIGIRQTDPGYEARTIGSIWVQEGTTTLLPGSAEVLRGAAAIAARIISRTANVPTSEGLLVQRLFGEQGGGVDSAHAANALGLSSSGPAAVIGFAPIHDRQASTSARLARAGSALRLRASAFRSDAMVSLIRGRMYVLFPEYKSARGVTTWTRHLVEEFESKDLTVLRAAVALPVSDLGQVANARSEVDRVLERTASNHPEGRVTTLAESRTAVLLGEVLDVMKDNNNFHDPRLENVLAYDRSHASALRESAEQYLAAHGDVRAAAEILRVHPNTLRYRIRRFEQIAGISLSDPADRLLLEFQLALLRRSEQANLS